MTIPKIRFMVSLILTLIALAIGHQPSLAEIYKWRDARGVMHYADSPPPVQAHVERWGNGRSQGKDAVLEDVSTAKANAEKMAVPVPKPQMTEAAQHAQLQSDPQAQILLRTKNCANARSNYRNFAVGGRMQSVGESGEREYLTDTQIQEGLAQAQRDIDEYCANEAL